MKDIYILIGFAIAQFLSGKKEGSPGILKGLIFNIGNKQIHLHHWLLSFLGLFLLNFFKVNTYQYDGLLFGMALQGLTYRDFLSIINDKL